MKLIFKRNFTGIDLLRPYHLYLNGKSKNKLYINKPVAIDVITEVHVFFVKIDWIQSSKVDLSRYDSDVKINVGVNPIFNISIFVMLGCVLLWDFTHLAPFKWTAFLAFGIIIYFYTIGKKNYFNIKLEN